MNVFTKLRTAAETVGQAMLELSGRLDASHPDYERGERLLELEKFVEAEECLLRAASDMNSHSTSPGVKVKVFLALARTQLKQKKLREARETAESAYELLTNKRPSGELSICLDLRGCIQQEDGDAAGAINLFREALELQQRVLPLEAAMLIKRYRRLASALQDADEVYEARDLLTRAVEVAEKRLGTSSPIIAECLIDLGRCQFRLGDNTAGICSMERAAEIHRETAGPTSEEVVRDLQSIASACQQAGDLESAVRYYELALNIRERQVGGSAADLAVLLMRLAESHSLLGNDAPAMELLQSAVGKLAGVDDARLAEALERLGEHYTRWGRITEAISCYQKARVVWEKDPDKHAAALQLNTLLLEDVMQYSPAETAVSVPIFKFDPRSASKGRDVRPNELGSRPRSHTSPIPSGPHRPRLAPVPTALPPLAPTGPGPSLNGAPLQIPRQQQSAGPIPAGFPVVLVPADLEMGSAESSHADSAGEQASALGFGGCAPEAEYPSSQIAIRADVKVIATPSISPVPQSHPGGVEISFVNANGSPISTAPTQSLREPLHLTVVLPDRGIRDHTLLVPADAADADQQHAPLTGWDELSFDFLPTC
jgi:tetratricopeptide (TPR) repeat protein